MKQHILAIVDHRRSYQGRKYLSSPWTRVKLRLWSLSVKERAVEDSSVLEREVHMRKGQVP